MRKREPTHEGRYVVSCCRLRRSHLMCARPKYVAVRNSGASGSLPPLPVHRPTCSNTSPIRPPKDSPGVLWYRSPLRQGSENDIAGSWESEMGVRTPSKARGKARAQAFFLIGFFPSLFSFFVAVLLTGTFVLDLASSPGREEAFSLSYSVPRFNDLSPLLCREIPRHGPTGKHLS
ncbi:hypothetical protein LZ30DRAFT_447245 [Colletotrichum cereale]|nr:hypothetical protein LZ30DRAFT_447245 [Colletotrichum cereale]